MIAQIWMAPWFPNYRLRLNLPMSQAKFFMGHNKKMEVVANLVSDEAVEFDQHRDNFSMEPTDFLEYFENGPKNYDYDG